MSSVSQLRQNLLMFPLTQYRHRPKYCSKRWFEQTKGVFQTMESRVESASILSKLLKGRRPQQGPQGHDDASARLRYAKVRVKAQAFSTHATKLAM